MLDMKRSGLAATSHPFVVLDFPGVNAEDSQPCWWWKACIHVNREYEEILNERLPLVALTILLSGIKIARSKETLPSLSKRKDRDRKRLQYWVQGGKKLEDTQKRARTPAF
jgi:hypothetical protein